MTEFDNDCIKKWNACAIQKSIDDNLKIKSFIVNLDLATHDTAIQSSASFLQKFSEDYKEYGCDSGHIQTTYKYVFVTIFDDDVVAVVGKTTFYCNFKDEECHDFVKLGQKNTGDLFFSYKNNVPKVVSCWLKHYYNVDMQDIDRKIKQAVIIPVQLKQFGQSNVDKEKVTEEADKEALRLEDKIRQHLLSENIFILNKN